MELGIPQQTSTSHWVPLFRSGRRDMIARVGGSWLASLYVGLYSGGGAYVRPPPIARSSYQ